MGLLRIPRDSNGSYQDLYAPRNFLANLITLPARFAFYRTGGTEVFSPKFTRECNMKKMNKNLGAVTLAGALLASLFLFSSPTKADVAAAEATFKAKCAGCHGADGKGKDALKTQDMTSDSVQKMSDAELSTIISSGKGKMPAYKTMTPDQVKDMVAYIRSLKK
jgi:mono/diheme cytochrome c family protein